MDTKKLRQKILDLAIRGKLVPQDPNDEPASVLIEKIRVEKERLIKEKKIKRDKKNESYIYRSDKSYYEKFADGTVKCIDEEIPFEIPKGWEWCRLGSVAFYKKGPFGSSITKSMFIPESENAIKVYEQKNAIYKDAEIGEYYISTEKFDELKGFQVFPGDIIVSCAGTIGETYIMPKQIRKGIINQALMRIKLYNHEILDFYLMYFDFVIKNQANEQGKGTAIKNIPPFDILKNFLIPLPPIEEQYRIRDFIRVIAEDIDYVDENRNTISALIAQSKSKILDLAIRGKLVPQDPNDEPASALLERIEAEHPESKKKASKTSDNSHYGNLPQGWTECTLENVGSWSSGATPNRANKAYYIDGTVNWLKTGDLNDSYIDFIPEKITDLALKECTVRLNPVDSVLIAMYGATIGKIGILNIPATTNQACCACITYSGIDNKFLFYLLMSQKRTLQMKAEGGAQPNISKEKIVSFPILLPPTQEQIRIVQAIDTLFNILDGIVESL